MKKLLLIAPLISAARAVTLTANFDGLTGSAPPTFTEGGLTFSTPGGFGTATGSWGATLFGWGGYVYQGTALSTNNHGWVSISAGGLLDSVSLKYGFDWNGYSIEFGLMDVNIEWQAFLGGNVVATGGLSFNREHKSHGGGLLTADPSVPFDQLLIRSTAVEYAPIPWVGPNPVGYIYDRGAVLGYGDLNHLAFDSVSAVLPTAGAVSTPDGGYALGMLVFALGVLLARRKS